MKKYLLFRKFGFVVLFGLFVMTGCKTTESVKVESSKYLSKQDLALKELGAMMETSPTFAKTITGFVLYDPAADSQLYGVNETKYMTPASNTKLFSFYAGLNVLGDRLPALKYVIHGDSLIFWGTGDPSFLHPDFGTNDVFDLMSSFDGNLYFSDSNFDDDVLGPGWSWADYDYYYSTEKSPLPIYGNVARFTMEKVEQYHVAQINREYQVSPKIFRDYIHETGVEKDSPVLQRDRIGNTYSYNPTSDTTRFQMDKPFHYTPQFTVQMVSDTLGKVVQYIDYAIPADAKTVYSYASDSLYRNMLLPSDNFIAEQLMLMVSGTLYDTLNTRKAIQYIIDTYMSDFPDVPNWRDGSGLSRYNLFTPRSMAYLLKKINEKVDDEKLFSMLPGGGEKGTIRHLYAERDGGPAYVFAKTGTLSNNHCLSGFVITETGRKLIFSFMNNNYTIRTSEVQAEMEKVLWFIHENF